MGTTRSCGNDVPQMTQKRREQTKRIATLLQQLAPNLAGDVADVTDLRELPREEREDV